MSKAEAEKKQETKTEKKESYKAMAERLQGELDKVNDVLLRTAAEFDNYKKRTDREKITTAEFAKAQLLKKILPCVDNFDRAMEADKGGEDYAKGLEMILKQLDEILKAAGLTEIEADGKTFDPNLHEAVMHIDDETKAENEIVAVLQKGYKLGDTVIRPAMVTVAN